MKKSNCCSPEIIKNIWDDFFSENPSSDFMRLNSEQFQYSSKDSKTIENLQNFLHIGQEAKRLAYCGRLLPIDQPSESHYRMTFEETGKTMSAVNDNSNKRVLIS